MAPIIIIVLLGVLTIIAIDVISLRRSFKRQIDASLDWLQQQQDLANELSRLDKNLSNLVTFSKLNRIIATKSRLYVEQSIINKKSNDTSIDQEKVSLPTHEIEIAYLMGVPGIGKTVAERLIDAFGSLSKLRRASVDEIQVVDRIGPELAERVKEFLDDPIKLLSSG